MAALSREPVSGFLVGSAEQNETSNLCHQNHSDLWDNDSKIHLYVYSQWETNTLFFSQFQFGREMFLSASFRPAPFFNSAVTRFLVSHTDAITIILVKFFHFRYIKERGICLSWPMRSLKQITWIWLNLEFLARKVGDCCDKVAWGEWSYALANRVQFLAKQTSLKQDKICCSAN